MNKSACPLPFSYYNNLLSVKLHYSGISRAVISPIYLNLLLFAWGLGVRNVESSYFRGEWFAESEDWRSTDGYLGCKRLGVCKRRKRRRRRSAMGSGFVRKGLMKCGGILAVVGWLVFLLDSRALEVTYQRMFFVDLMSLRRWPVADCDKNFSSLAGGSRKHIWIH